MSDIISEGDCTPETSECGEVKMAKPPDKKKHEATIAELMQQIESTQNEMRALTGKTDDSTTELQRSLRAEKDATIGRRKNIDSDLSTLHQDIRKKNNELTKVQGNLQGYRNEQRIDGAIKRMEDQLKMNNFKLSEEKKLVSEIDSLKRSKKVLCVVNGLKKEVDSMKDQQRRMRGERDHYFKKVTEIKHREDAIKRKTHTDKVRQEELKKEIDTLYEQKRKENSDFKAQEKEFYKYRGSVRLKQKHDFQLKKVEKRIAYEQELAEYEASRDPYEHQKQLCKTIITYLQGFLSDKADSHDADTVEQGSSGHDSDTLAQSFESEGLFLLRKKEEDLFSGVNKPRTRRSKKDKKRVLQTKPLNHRPQTLLQFAELQIKAPATVQEVPEAILQVQSKKTYYESLPPPPPPKQCIDGLPPGDDSSAGAPSIAESAITESIPSTPEVQGDAAANPFLRETNSPWRAQRKLSLDSGACELETDNEETKTPDCSLDMDPLQTVEYSDDEKMASGDFPWKGDLSRRTLSTVSSLSDKDSSASSDTVVEAPLHVKSHHVDAMQTRSCDDLKAISSVDTLSPSSYSTEAGDCNVGSDWLKELGGDNIEAINSTCDSNESFGGVRRKQYYNRPSIHVRNYIQKLSITSIDQSRDSLQTDQSRDSLQTDQSRDSLQTDQSRDSLQTGSQEQEFGELFVNSFETEQLAKSTSENVNTELFSTTVTSSVINQSQNSSQMSASEQSNKGFQMPNVFNQSPDSSDNMALSDDFHA